MQAHRLRAYLAPILKNNRLNRWLTRSNRYLNFCEIVKLDL